MFILLKKGERSAIKSGALDSKPSELENGIQRSGRNSGGLENVLFCMNIWFSTCGSRC